MMMGNDYFRLRERFDWPLFISAALVAVVGIVNLYSATSVYSGARAEQYVNQVYWLVAGGILAVFAASIDYRHFERLGYGYFADHASIQSLGNWNSYEELTEEISGTYQADSPPNLRRLSLFET